jgi:hypothetical protein
MRTPVLAPEPAPAAPRVKKSRRMVVTREHPEIAYRLLDDFNLWRGRCSAVAKAREAHRVSEMKPNDERLEILAEMDRWCAERRIDSRLWLFLCFRLRRWFYPPLISRGELLAEAKIVDYRNMRGLDAYRRHVAPKSAPRTFDPNRDMAPHIEAQKRRLVDGGRAALCMALGIEETLGFHPRSEVCGRCPLANECRAQLEAFADFDILALRRGEITAEQAQDQAHRARTSQRTRTK